MFSRNNDININAQELSREVDRLKQTVKGLETSLIDKEIQQRKAIAEMEIKHMKDMAQQKMKYEDEIATLRHTFGSAEELTQLRAKAVSTDALKLKQEAAEDLLTTYRQLPDLQNIYSKINDLKLPDTSALLSQVGELANAMKKVESTEGVAQMTKLAAAIETLTQRVEFLATRVR